MEQSAKTALGSARERFIEGLSRRADELRSAISAVRPIPDRAPAREELQRKLHTLLASAQLFERTALAEQLQKVTARLDAASKAREAWTDDDFELLEELVAKLASEHLEVAGQPSSVLAEAELPAGSEEAPQLEQRSASGPIEPVSVGLSWRPPPGQGPSAPIPGDLDAPLGVGGELPLLVTQTLPGSVAAPGLARLLLVCSRPHAVKLREWLEGSPLEIVHAADAEAAVRMLHESAPSLALLSAEYADLPDVDLIRRLQTDPLSKLGGVYVLLAEGSSYDDKYLRQIGADGLLIEPLTAAQIDQLVQQCTRPGRGGLRALSALGDSTVDDIASHVAEEIRSGIADALRGGQNERIRLGDAQELMSAAWSAIDRVRSHLSEQSRGRISFREDKVHELSQFLEPERSAAPALDTLKVLAGKRVLIADDDPAVMWFFSGLLREGGAQVLQAQNGRDALAQARRKQPQLILSDILMPKIDGFALCRELQRDALLAHVPVILLSWKDDYLERMRELDAGASGYLRKEASTKEVLAAIDQALRPRQQLLAALGAEQELRGRIDGLGTFALLESVAAVRPDARVAIQDAWNVFEVDIRNGQRLSVTRTAADGSFARGERALVQLLGVAAGRFAVGPGNTSLRNPLAEALAPALQSAGKALSALMHAVSDPRLVQVARLTFEEDVVESLLKRTPTRMHEVVARFKAGANASELLLDGSFSAAELENHLRDLARRGAISGVWNEAGDDLVAQARREREEQPGSLQHSSHPESRDGASRRGSLSNQTTWFSTLRPQRASDRPPASKPAPALGPELIANELRDDLDDPEAALRELAAASARSQPAAASGELPAPAAISSKPPPLPAAMRARSATPQLDAAAFVPGTPLPDPVAGPAILRSAETADALPPSGSGTLPQQFLPGSPAPASEERASQPPMAADEVDPHPQPLSANGTLPQQFLLARGSPPPFAAQSDAANDLDSLLPPAEPNLEQAARSSLTAPQPFRVAPAPEPETIHHHLAVASQLLGGLSEAPAELPSDNSSGRIAAIDHALPSKLGRPQPSAAGLALARATPSWAQQGSASLAPGAAQPPSAADDSRLLRVAAQLSQVDHAYLSETARRQLEAADAGRKDWLPERGAGSMISDHETVALSRGRRRWGEAFEGMRLALTLAALVAVGYFGWQRLEPGAHPAATPAPASAPPSPTFSSNTPGTSTPAPAAPPPSANVQRPAAPVETSLHSGIDPDLSLGRILPYVDPSRGIAVGPEQGLLVIEYQGESPAPRVRIGGRELGQPPLAIALSAGRQELVVQRNRESSFRFLVMRAGETRIITLPL